MEALLAWGFLLVLALVFVLALRGAGSPGDPRPKCGMRDGGGRFRCH